MIPGIVAAANLGSFQVWTPADLAVPPKIWLDDDSTVIEISGAVSQWNDRSGNGVNFAQGTAVDRPAILAGELNGRRILRFDGVNDHMHSGSLSVFQNVPAAAIFAVYKKRSTDPSPQDRALALFGTDSASVTRAGLFAARTTANTPQFGARRVDADSFYPISAAGPSMGSYVMALGVADYGARTVGLYIDGAAPTVSAGAFGAAGNSSNTVGLVNRIGAGLSATPTLFGDFDLAAVLALTTLSSSDIDKLFGWAAHRYGLTGNLPIGHPYKSVAP